MQGSIRFFVGLLVTLGAVGGMDAPDANLLAGVALAALGLATMYSGVKAMNLS